MLKIQNILSRSTRLLLQRSNTEASENCDFTQQRQPIWGYVAIAFNRVDADRLIKVGPNRLCAEWMLKNGGGVRLVELPSKLLRDYNSLPPENYKFHIKVADASNSSIMKIGLDHFNGCRQIDTVIFHNCKHLEEDSLGGLLHLKDTLTFLEVSGCSNINENGLQVLGQLTNLKKLVIFDLLYVKNLQKVAEELRHMLPSCQIETK